MKMRLKIKTKIIVDILLLISGLLSTITGIILLLSPSGPGTYRGLKTAESILDLTSRSSLKLLHDWGSIILVLLVIIHIILNWSTITCYIKNMFRAVRNRSCEN
jgi:quinol-cytochrome oxidoreductase complex cytochrome b subunit